MSSTVRMLELKVTSKFRKDYKRVRKQGKDLQLLETVIDELLSGQPLAEKYRDHVLTGSYIGFRECHIAPDWLLIYQINREMLILTAVRTGSHSDLF